MFGGATVAGGGVLPNIHPVIARRGPPMVKVEPKVKLEPKVKVEPKGGAAKSKPGSEKPKGGRLLPTARMSTGAKAPKPNPKTPANPKFA